MKGRRQERAASEIRIAVSNILLREVKDPRLARVLVTRVEVSVDLKHARVYVVGPVGSEEERRVLAGLARAQGFLRSQVGRRLAMRYTPELSFAIDRSLDAAGRLERLLEEARSAEPPLASEDDQHEDEQ